MEVAIRSVGVAAIGIDSGFAINGLGNQRIGDLVTIGIGSCGQLARVSGVFVQCGAGIGSNREVVD